METNGKKAVGTILVILGVIFTVNVLSNLGSVLSFSLIGPLVFDPESWASSNILFEAIQSWEWLTMVVPSVLVALYSLPVYIVIYRILTRSPLKRLRPEMVLDTPLKISLLGMSGWLVEEILFFLVWYRERSIPVSTLMVNSLQMILASLTSFVVSFLLLEIFFRRFVIPRIFPEGKLSELPDNIKFSIRGRFFIHYLSAFLYPGFILSLFLFTRLSAGENPLHYTLMIAALAVSGILLTLLVSDYFRRPLLQMKREVLKIRKGEFDIRLPVTSNDELGLLSESLNDLGRELREKVEMKETFGKVVDPSVRDHLMKGNAGLGGEEREVTVLFTDIRNYTGLTESMAPEQVVTWLNRYFDAVTEAITRQGGIVNKYIGDAIMAVFGAPDNDPEHAAHAVSAALDMVRAREALNTRFVLEGYPPIKAGIGIHTGTVLAGNIGSSSRMEYTVIGDTVNVAARVEKATKELNTPLLLTEMTRDRISGGGPFRKAATCRLRGRTRPVRLYTPIEE